MIWTIESCKFAITRSKCEKNRKRCPGVTCKEFKPKKED